jgi:hypothetical protein
MPTVRARQVVLALCSLSILGAIPVQGLLSDAAAAGTCSATLTDAPLDVQLAADVNGSSTQVVNAQYNDIDLTQVSVGDVGGKLAVTFNVLSLTSMPGPNSAPLGQWNLTFTAGQHRYAVHVEGAGAVVNAGDYYGWWGFHVLRDGKALSHVTGAFDTQKSQVDVQVPSVSLGRTLTRVQAQTNAVLANLGTPVVDGQTRLTDAAATKTLRLTGC